MEAGEAEVTRRAHAGNQSQHCMTYINVQRLIVSCHLGCENVRNTLANFHTMNTGQGASLEVEEVGVVVSVVHSAAAVRLLVVDQLAAVLALQKMKTKNCLVPVKQR